MSELPKQYCHIHPKRETMRSCSRCGRPACPACLRDAPVGQHCTECIKAAAGPASARVKRTTVANARMMKSMDMPVTRIIIAINAAVFVYTVASTQLSNDNLGVIAEFARADGTSGGVAKGEWYRLLTSGFIHFGIMHIAFNMFALWQLGRFLEPAMGRIRYVGLYTVSLLGGSFGALLFQPFGLTGGASGAVFGLAAAATVAMHQRGVAFNRTWGPMLLINLALSVGIRGVSLGGHLGGLVFGAIVGAVLMNPKRRGRNLQRDVAVLVGLGVVAIVLAVAVSKSPVNGNGLWPRT